MSMERRKRAIINKANKAEGDAESAKSTDDEVIEKLHREAQERRITAGKAEMEAVLAKYKLAMRVKGQFVGNEIRTELELVAL